MPPSSEPLSTQRAAPAANPHAKQPLDPMVWRRMLANVRMEHPTLNRSWFKDLEAQRLSNGVIQIHCQSLAHLHFLQGRCQQPFTAAAQGVTGQLVSVTFHCDNLPIGGVFERGEQPMPLSPDHVFENFVEGPCNRLAFSAAQAVVGNPGKDYNPLFIHGGVGLGKTHLLQGVALGIIDRKPESRIMYLSCESFIRDYFSGVEKGKMEGFRHRYREVDVLIVDDIQFLKKHDQIQEEFFHTFNELKQRDKQIILSADSPPVDIPELANRLVSRFGAGMVARVDKPGYETRVAIVKKKASIRGIDLPDEVATLIAARVENNIREIEGALTAVQCLATVEDKPITPEMARHALGAEPKPAKALKVDHIHRIVADFYGVKPADMQGKRRLRSLVWPRQVAMWLARDHTRHSLSEIGAHFGGRDHTTVMYAVNTVNEKAEADPATQQELAQVTEKVLE
jgi:chromosomal replication initiator protein